MLQRAGANESDLIAAVAGDLDADGRYGEVWIAVTASDLFIVWSPGTGSRPPEKGGSQACPREEQVERIPLAGVDEVTTENLVGNGFLVATVRGEARRLCQFTNYPGPGSSAFSPGSRRRCERAKRCGRKITPTAARAVLPRCGRLYPDPDRAICPRCMDRRAVTLRVLSFFGGYKAHVAAVIVLMLLGLRAGPVLALHQRPRPVRRSAHTGRPLRGPVFEVDPGDGRFSLASIGVSILHARINAHDDRPRDRGAQVAGLRGACSGFPWAFSPASRRAAS